METTNNRPMQDILHTDTPKDKIPKESKPLVEKEQIENSPFWIIGELGEEQKWFLVMGEHRISPILNSKEEILKYADENTWNIIFHVSIILAEKVVNERISKQFS